MGVPVYELFLTSKFKLPIQTAPALCKNIKILYKAIQDQTMDYWPRNGQQKSEINPVMCVEYNTY